MEGLAGDRQDYARSHSRTHSSPWTTSSLVFFLLHPGISTEIVIQEVGNFLQNLHGSGAAENISSLIHSGAADQISRTLEQVQGDLTTDVVTVQDVRNVPEEGESAGRESHSRTLRLILGSALLVVARGRGQGNHRKIS